MSRIGSRKRIHADRIARRHRHHRGPDRPPASGGAVGREAARRAQCTNNLKQFGAGGPQLSLNLQLSARRDDVDGCHVRQLAASSGSWGWNASWPVCLLPNIEQSPLYNAYNQGSLRLPRTRRWRTTPSPACFARRTTRSSVPTVPGHRWTDSNQGVRHHSALERDVRDPVYLLDHQPDPN